VTDFSSMQPPTDPELTKRALDVIEYGAKVAIALAAIYALVERIAKPYYAWRKSRLAIEIRDALKPELERLDRLGICADRIELVLERQKALFSDIDDFIKVASTNTERIDETNDLLNAVGFSSDRRDDSERRARVEQLLRDLADRQKSRRRLESEIDNDTDETPIDRGD
jgi:hypothetical protein